MAQQNHAIEDVFGSIEAVAESRDRKVSVGDITDALGDRGHGPFLFVPAVLESTPIGGIPGVPTLLAAIIAVFAAQIALGRDTLWLPETLRRRAIHATRVRKAMQAMQPAARRIDRWFPERLPQLSGPAARRAAAVLSLLLCLTVPPLEFVPFASSAPMVPIAIFGLAMTLRDGLLMAVGFALTAAAVFGVGFGAFADGSGAA